MASNRILLTNIKDVKKDSDAHHSSRRVYKEYTILQKDPLDFCSIGLVDDALYFWHARIMGPLGSPYAGGVFLLDFFFHNTYPFNPPKVLFKTKVYHPNIDSNGNICLHILRCENWSPRMTISEVLLSIFNLLAEPDTDDAIVPSIAHTCKADWELYEATARSWTQIYAS